MKHPAPLAQAVSVAKALAHPARLRILAMLRQRPLCVCQLTAVLGSASSTISGHLLDLRLAGLVAERRQGKWVEYRLSDDPDAERAMGPLLAAAADDPQLGSDRVALEAVAAVPVEVLCRVGLDVAAARDITQRRAAGRRRAARRRPTVST